MTGSSHVYGLLYLSQQDKIMYNMIKEPKACKNHKLAQIKISGDHSHKKDIS